MVQKLIDQVEGSETSRIFDVLLTTHVTLYEYNSWSLFTPVVAYSRGNGLTRAYIACNFFLKKIMNS